MLGVSVVWRLKSRWSLDHRPLRFDIDRNRLKIFKGYHGVFINSGTGTSRFGLRMFWIVIARWWNIIDRELILAAPNSSVINIGAKRFHMTVINLWGSLFLSSHWYVRIIVLSRWRSLKNAIFRRISFVSAGSRSVQCLPLVLATNCHILGNVSELFVWLVLAGVGDVVDQRFRSWLFAKTFLWRARQCYIGGTLRLIESWWWIAIGFEFVLALPGHVVFNVLAEWYNMAIILARTWIISMTL